MRAWVLEELLMFAEQPDFVFLTGDLGFNFLEPLQARLGSRFINVGIAEQNMVSVAAGLAREGMRPFCYSISPFLYARAFEQIRVDACLNKLPVQMIGSGAGFDYGAMGPEHHALEDYGVLSSLQDLQIFLPWSRQSVGDALQWMWQSRGPSYLRLDRQGLVGPKPSAGQAWSRLLSGTRGVFLCAGSSIVPFYHFWKDQDERPSLWVVDRLPLAFPPDEFLHEIEGTSLFIVEEHVPSGGLGEKVKSQLYSVTQRPRLIETFSVHEVFSGFFGNRDFHWTENGLAPEQLKAKWSALATGGTV